LAHEVGAAAAGQVTSQRFVSLQRTWHEPAHSTTQEVTLVQVM
jgi:hypothetical protein